MTAAAGKGTPRAGVHGDLVLTSGVDALDDVDFAAVRPVWTEHPEGGPSAANTAGHVGKVDDH